MGDALAFRPSSWLATGVSRRPPGHERTLDESEGGVGDPLADGEETATFMTLHRSTLELRRRRADALSAAGHHDEALDSLRQLITDCEQTPGVGPNHPYTLELRRRRADALSAAGHHDEALDSLRQLITDCEQTPGVGPNHPYTLEFRNDFLFALHDEGYVSRRRPTATLSPPVVRNRGADGANISGSILGRPAPSVAEAETR